MHPNFFIIGAPRAGTTSLHDYLCQHPDIFMSKVKEPFTLAFKNGEFIDDDPNSFPIHKRNYKGRFSIPNYDEYLALFDEAGNKKAIGEASTIYMHSSFARENIKKLYPNAKLIVSLRNPVDQVYSTYLFGIRQLRGVSYKIGAEEFLKLAENNQAEFLSHFDAAFYYKHLEPYFNEFRRNQIHVFLFDDFAKDLGVVLKGIFNFLEVDPGFVPSAKVRNKGAVCRSRATNYILHKSRAVQRSKNFIKTRMPGFIRRPVVSLMDFLDDLNSTKPGPLPPETRGKIMEIFREDTLKLQDLIHRDLSKWINN